jgi:regulator of sirC expression with transglutaminase-like and TPR domain
VARIMARTHSLATQQVAVASTSTATRRQRACARVRSCRRGLSLGVRRASFFGRSDAEQWLANDDDGDSREAEDDIVTTNATLDVNEAFAAVSAARRGLELFKMEMDKGEEEIDVLAAACFIAMHRTPDINVDDIREELERMSEVIEAQLPTNTEERFPLRTIKTISRVFAQELNFVGNIEDYYDVRNSCIDEVLKRRTGIPITLCLVYMELAARVGVKMVDVSIPGHLLCRPVADDMEVLVDAFNQGDLLFIEQVEDILTSNSMLSEGQKVQIDRSFLEQREVRKKAFLTRILGNLKSIYMSLEDFPSALLVTEYMMVCNPYESLEVPLFRTLGMLYYSCGRWVDAIETLELYLLKAGLAENADDEVRLSLDAARRVLTLEKDVLSTMAQLNEEESDD